jgi:hypothetical protein
MVEARRAASVTTARRTDHARAYGLDVDIPSAPALLPADTRVCYLSATLVAEAAVGEPRDVVLRELAAERLTRAGESWRPPVRGLDCRRSPQISFRRRQTNPGSGRAPASAGVVAALNFTVP